MPTVNDETERCYIVSARIRHPQQAEELVGLVAAKRIRDFRCRVAFEYLTEQGTRGNSISELELRMKIQCRQEGYGPERTAKELISSEWGATFVQRLVHLPVNAYTGRVLADAVRAEASSRASAPTAPSFDTAPRPEPPCRSVLRCSRSGRSCLELRDREPAPSLRSPESLRTVVSFEELGLNVVAVSGGVSADIGAGGLGRHGRGAPRGAWSGPRRW